MLQYLIILLDDTSTSFCHYEVPNKEKYLMALDILRKGIRFAMRENLMIQFVCPNEDLPREYRKEIERVEHSKIKPIANDADVWVLNGWDFPDKEVKVPLVVRISKVELFTKYKDLKGILSKTPRLNVVITDIETFREEDVETYKNVLTELSEYVVQLYVDGKSPQLNLLTDRMMLSEMNNCGAGEISVTLAPNGKFYICPAFYYEDETDCLGDINAPDFKCAEDLDIRNKQLYQLTFAPICRRCDAWQCKRCVWLNRKTTLEVNTPSHEQCVIAHLERNASRQLMTNIRKFGSFLPEKEEINEINYLDPFDNIESWE